MKRLRVNHHQLYNLLPALEEVGYQDIADEIRKKLSASDCATTSMFIEPGLQFLGLWDAAVSKQRTAGRKSK